jgi:beta-galactosidase
MQEDDHQIIVGNDDWQMVFDKKKGRLAQWVKNEVDLVSSGVKPDFWRAPTDNDRGAGLTRADNRALSGSNIWKTQGNQWAPNSVVVDNDQLDGTQITFSGPIMEGNASLYIKYHIHTSGKLKVDFHYSATEELPMLPRVGMEWVMDADFDQLQWYGPGPLPTYSDRNFERVGLYTSTTMDNWIDYSKPQENGNKVDLRWLTLTNKKGQGIQVMGQNHLSCNALPYHNEQIENTDYSWQLGKPKHTYLNIDYAQMGVGGDNSWGLICHPEYRLTSKEYRYEYQVHAIGF